MSNTNVFLVEVKINLDSGEENIHRHFYLDEKKAEARFKKEWDDALKDVADQELEIVAESIDIRNFEVVLIDELGNETKIILVRGPVED